MEYFRHLPYVLNFNEGEQLWHIVNREYGELGRIKLTDIHIARLENQSTVYRDLVGKPERIILYLDKTYPMERISYWKRYTECLRVLVEGEYTGNKVD